jgi:PAS domain S-box-containing protein
VESLFQEHGGRIWVSTRGGVAYFENGRFVPVSGLPGGIVHSIAGDSAGNLWFSYEDQGLFHLLGGRVVERIPWSRLGRDDVRALLSDPVQGGLWLGFAQGGVTYFKDGQVRASYAAKDGLGEGLVSGLQLDPDGTLWAATQGGLSRVKNGRVATLTSKNGLPCDAVQWSLEDDDHSFWLYMACGFVRIARQELDAWVADPKRMIQTTVFDGSDGVRSHSFVSGYTPRVAKSADGRLWFLPFDGVSVIDPRHLPINRIPPPVHVEQITADRKTYWQNLTGDASSSHPRLPPLVRDLEIDYTALSLVVPEKVRFRVKLEGWDRDWKDAGNERKAFYSNLPPRKYRFRVIACNNSGVWNEAGTFLDFSIAPAYYQTNWFRLSSVAAFLALLWALYRGRIQRVRRQEKKLRDVIETIPTFAWTALPDGSEDFVNRHWHEYSGLSAKESVGSGWEAAVHPADLKRHLEKWRASLASDEPFENEVHYRRAADGQYRWFLARAVPLRDARGKILKWYGISTDIEDRKRAEEERERLRSDLAHVNRVSMLGELAASVSHELKQPITAAMTNAKTCLRWLKREQPDVDEAIEATSRIVNDGTRATEVIDRLRSLYKKDLPQRELVEVNEIIREMVELLRAEANQYAASIRTDLVDNLPKIMADRVQLQQVFMNLILNAIEAMKETGGVLTVKTQLGEDGQLLISVSDTGVGLPKEKIEQIFDAFVTTKPQGSGMGLSISRSIVESHGGRLWATANNGRGATFHFTLPTAADVVRVSDTGT